MISEVANHLWQSTLFAGAAGLLAMGFRRNMAKVRFWLWLSASIKFLVPFALLISLGSLLEWKPTDGGTPAQNAAPSASVRIAQISQPFPGNLSVAPSPPNKRDWRAAAVLALWLSGFAGVLLVRLRGWRSVRLALRSSHPISLPLPVDVRVSAGILEPGVVGVLRPVLLLPAAISEHLTPPQLHSVLMHEMCHVRRRDNLFASIHMAVEAAFWFHPLVWWLGARLVQERERACDEEVLSMGGDPHVYAEGILNVCKFYLASPLANVSGVSGADLKARIEAIMTNRGVLKLTIAKKAALAAAGLAALLVPIAVGVLNAPLIRAQSGMPRFETVSIKACVDEPGSMRGVGHELSAGRLNTGCMALAYADNTGLIQRAFVRFADGQPHPSGMLPITGGPNWIHSERFEIEARAGGNPSEAMMQGPMLQALLEDRFRLKIRREARVVPVYALTLERNAPALKPFQEGSCIPMPAAFPPPPLTPGQQYCKVRVGIQPPSVEAQGATITEFCQMLDLVLDRPVVDNTAMAGKFDIHLEFAVDATTPRFLPGGDLARFAASAANRTNLPIFSAIQQLGLKLEPAQGSREFLVIDHVERPALH